MDDLSALREENQQLQRSLERCQQLNRDSINEMQHFIYAVSHDLRNPLRGVTSYATLLQRQFSSDASAAELTAFILEGAHEMNRLIEDLLKYSRSGSTPRRTHLPLATLVQFSVFNLQTLIKETNAEITVDELPEAAVDESQFVQLFTHLLDNALKYGAPAVAPKISISCEEPAAPAGEKPDGVVICVRDNGPGIDPRFHQTVFTPFNRLHGKEIPGSGLGLPMAAKIVRAHGGEIWLRERRSTRLRLQVKRPQLALLW